MLGWLVGGCAYYYVFGGGSSYFQLSRVDKGTNTAKVAVIDHDHWFDAGGGIGGNVGNRVFVIRAEWRLDSVILHISRCMSARVMHGMGANY